MLEAFCSLISIIYFPVTLGIMIIYALIYENKHPFANLMQMIVSELPLMQVSQDIYFHECKDNYSERRYSLLYFPLWTYKIYFFTYTKSQKFQFYHSLSFGQIYEKRQDNLEKTLPTKMNLSWEKIDYNNQRILDNNFKFLKERCLEFKDIQNTAKLKGAFYITIIAAIISAFIGQINQIKCLITYHFEIKIVISLLFLYFINITVLLLNFMGIKSFIQEKYSDFRDEFHSSDKGLYNYWYMNFLRLAIVSNRDTSYILNVEKYIKLFLLWFSILGIILAMQSPPS